MRQTIVLADGYNGATEPFDAAPVRRDESGSVLFRCGGPGVGDVLRWASADEYRAALGADGVLVWRGRLAEVLGRSRLSAKPNFGGQRRP